jgi:hypothetical protein
MTRVESARLRGGAFRELLRYDALSTCGGFPRIRRRMGSARKPARKASVEAVVDAVAWMTSFYWKPLLCLQRSVVTARLLRAEGFEAEVVIGCRAKPFYSHAWVEVDGRVVNDSSACQTKLQPLDRF